MPSETVSRTDRDAAGAFDPVLLAVIANRFDTIVREMGNTLLRTGRSTDLNTARDFSCAIVTADNKLVATGEGLPIHILGSELLTESMQRFHPDLREGDVFLHNDPYNGNSHHADFNVLIPMFHNGEHRFTAVAKAHLADCGNAEPTTYAAAARDIYEEGALNFPCVLVQRDGKLIDDIVRMCRHRLRVPEQWFGDFLAMLGAARTGERGLQTLLAKYGAEVVAEFLTSWFDYSERRMMEEISRLPAGVFTATSHHDPTPNLPDGIPLRLTIHTDPENGRVEVDLTENVDCVPAGFNLSRACALAAGMAGIFNQLREQVPHNHGSFKRIEVKLRENCVAGYATHPTSCPIATSNVADRIINMAQSAFAGVADGLGLAEGAIGIDPGFGFISGVDGRRDREPYINGLFLASSGGPAAPENDGWPNYGVPVTAGLMYRDSIELLESHYPIMVDELRLRQDSEGAGRFRGANGLRIVYGPTDDPMVTAYVVDGHHHPPKGVRGGLGGGRHEVMRRDAGGAEKPAGLVATEELGAGERIISHSCGGGGYGHPHERDPDLVRGDVEAGLVSAGRARDVYGVSLGQDSARRWSVDHEATGKLRAAAAGAV